MPETLLPLEADFEIDARSLKELNKQKTPWNSSNARLKSLLQPGQAESQAVTKRKPKINKDEELALEHLFRKYRLAFKKMKLDIKSNIF